MALLVSDFMAPSGEHGDFEPDQFPLKPHDSGTYATPAEKLQGYVAAWIAEASNRTSNEEARVWWVLYKANTYFCKEAARRATRAALDGVGSQGFSDKQNELWCKLARQAYDNYIALEPTDAEPGRSSYSVLRPQRSTPMSGEHYAGTRRCDPTRTYGS